MKNQLAFLTILLVLIVGCKKDEEIIPDEPINNGLIAFYPFNGNAQDESGNINHGDIDGAVLTTDRFGNPNSAYYFDGTDDRIILKTLDVFKEDEFTITAWFNITNILPGDRSTDWIINTPSGGMAIVPKDRVDTTNILLQGYTLDYESGGQSGIAMVHESLKIGNNWYFGCIVKSNDELPSSIMSVIR